MARDFPSVPPVPTVRETAAPAAPDLADYLSRQIEFSRRTFGEGKRTLGVTAHIGKELDEIRQKPDDLSEWVDVIILAMDGYWRHGGTPNTLMRDLQAKQDKNVARKWPAPTSEDVPVEHDRSADVAPPAAPDLTCCACGAVNRGGYEAEDVQGVYCRDCWDDLRKSFGRDVLADLRAKVEALEPDDKDCDPAGYFPDGFYAAREAVLALLAKEK